MSTISPHFLRTLTKVVARSSCDGVAIRYVLPVLWMASCLHIAARNRRREMRVYNTYRLTQSDSPGENSYLLLSITSVRTLIALLPVV